MRKRYVYTSGIITLSMHWVECIWFRLTDAVNVILIGAGEGCYGIEHLVKNRGILSQYESYVIDVDDTVKGVINFFGDFEPKSIGDTDEDKIYWYLRVPHFRSRSDIKSSRVYVGPRNPILRRKKIPKRFGQCLQSRNPNSLPAVDISIRRNE